MSTTSATSQMSRLQLKTTAFRENLDVSNPHMHTVPKDFLSVWVFSSPCAGINMMKGGAQGNVGALQSSFCGWCIKAGVCVSNPSNGRG